VAICFLAASALGAVRIHEFMAATSERRLSWDASGWPRLGSGLSWTDPDFSPMGWESVFLPAGYGFSGLATDLGGRMKGKAPSVYLRKEFVVGPETAASPNALVLSVQYNDGFVAYLNGRPVARGNCGLPGHFMYASQPACNVNTNGGVIDFPLGPAAQWLVVGTNLLAIQAHNAEQPSTVSAPEQIARRQATPEFRVNAGLRLVIGTNSLPLVPTGAAGGTWQCWVGRVEPAGGVVDMGLVTRGITAPAGQEDDYEQPAEFADWIELRNDGPDEADLSGWTLTDDRAQPGNWRFPTNTVVPGDGYLLVLCDNRDEANAPVGPATRLHTNFKLSDEGEYLALYDDKGVYVDGFPEGFPPQAFFCSYGRDPEDPSRFGYFGTATPGSQNRGPFYLARVAEPQFLDADGRELPGGRYLGQTPNLILRPTTPGSQVRYTLDGSTPTATNGFDYVAPIRLTQANDKTGVVVRASAFLPGWLPSVVATHSYLLRQPALLTNSPALFLTGEAGRTFYRPDGILAISGGRFVPVNYGTIWQAGGPDTYNLALGYGVPAERETVFEYYPCEGPAARVLAGLRLSTSDWQLPRMRLTSAATGSPWPPSDNTEKPSFNLHFTGDYGSGMLDYPLFTNGLTRQFRHLRLRAGKNDNLNPFVTDELVRRLWLDLGHTGAQGNFTSLYVNGVYKGIYNLCERVREAFFQAHYRTDSQWDINYVYSWVDGDAAAYQQLLTFLDRNLTNLVNYQAVADRIDLDNTADYFLLNIYSAMWDWPGNNFIIARERSTGPNSRFRFVVWDAEGAFNAIGYGRPASYNTLTNDLLLPPGHAQYNLDLPRIFRRLASAPEFRLRFADRVHRHCFNGGVLDDRDPDGAGPQKSHLRERAEAIGREAGDLVRYNTGQTINLGSVYAWASPTSGRRSYLLGTNPGRRHLRDAGLWPLTEPPVFNVFGGSVPPGFALTMSSSVAATGQTATVFFTLDGSDPRLPGGGLATAARIFSEPVPLNQVATAKARARNDLTGEWSALTEATFAVGAVRPSAQNLALVELMYHPPGPTAAETAAGFGDADEFEFVRLLNVGAESLDLGGVRFSMGIGFDFAGANIRYLGPGQSLLVLKNRNAFRFRYGAKASEGVAGEYSGNLANGGERLQLLGADQEVLVDLAYNDRVPWPLTADGGGPSLLLVNPEAHPDPALGSNWVASAVPGGLPGAIPPEQNYAQWRSLFWPAAAADQPALSGLAADSDGDGLLNFVEYALGLNPHEPSVRPRLEPTVEWTEGTPRLSVQFRLAPGALEARWAWESSLDVLVWDESAEWKVVEETSLGDGTVRRTFAEPGPGASSDQRFVRVRLIGE
jgi:hypothetical protein